MFKNNTIDRNLKHEIVSFLSFLTMIPLSRPPIINGGMESKPIISDEVPDGSLYWYSRNNGANARKLFWRRPSIVVAIITNT